MTIFDSLEMAPRDPILGLSEAYAADANPQKLNLSVGVYCDSAGQTPVLECVRRARAQIVERETSKGYLPMTGAPAFASAAQALVFGEQSAARAAGRVISAHTPGGTGALRVAGELIAQASPGARVWLSTPTWPNHPAVFGAAGLETASYPYFDARRHGLDAEAFEAALKEVQPGDVVLLHGCCHNPTGVDLRAEQWSRVADLAAERGFIPLLDFAYQGLGDGIEEDAAGVRVLSEKLPLVLVCSSMSKNFGLYNERVGALHVVSPDAERAAIIASHLKRVIRANYSNPPAHGGAIVSTVLEDAELRVLWKDEVAAMRERILGVRRKLVRALGERKVPRDFSFIEEQRGMFSFTGLSREQVAEIRARFAIYIVDSGRINVAGIRDDSLERVAEAFAAVL